jgi:hypothetical protein
LSFLHEAAVENWSTKDFTFTYTVSYPLPFLDYLHLFAEAGIKIPFSKKIPV